MIDRAGYVIGDGCIWFNSDPKFVRGGQLGQSRMDRWMDGWMGEMGRNPGATAILFLAGRLPLDYVILAVNQQDLTYHSQSACTRCSVLS